MSNLQEAFKKFIEKREQEELIKQRDERIELLIRINSAVFEKAIAYTNVIMLAGYAGAFALLGMTKDLLNPKILIISALLLTFSLMVFCAWEITKMIVNSKTFLKIVPLVKEQNTPQDFFRKLANFETSSNKINLIISRWWPIVLVTSILPGFLAGLLLLLNYVFLLAA